MGGGACVCEDTQEFYVSLNIVRDESHSEPPGYK